MLELRTMGAREGIRWATAAALLGLAACSDAPPAEGGGADDEESLDALVGASCNEETARRYDGFLHDGASCADVDGDGGAWVARPLFKNAPPEIASQACRFTWKGRTSRSEPDRDALFGRSPRRAALRDLQPSCGRGSPTVVDPREREPSMEDIVPMGGTVGCDVCGILRNRDGFIVRPPYVDRIRFHADLANASGTPVQSKKFEVPSTPGRAVVVRLPEPPPGLHYVDGPVRFGLR